MDGFSADRAIEVGRRWLLVHASIFAVSIAVLGSMSCSRGPRAIGEAFVGPLSLVLREDLTPRARETARLKHGDRLEILEYQRRWAHARTASGAMGWTDSRLLLKSEQMARLRNQDEKARSLPSQGQATPLDLLNVHIEPNRYAPSFYQIPEGESADLVKILVAPRVPYLPDAKPGMPVPVNTPVDTFGLVRIKDGRSGWVLFSMLMMSIPDEVAQYAEGHRITSYFSLGTVEDGGQLKHHWLWTTANMKLVDHQFNAIRIFTWSTQRHRYETSFIERNLKGYFPIEVTPAKDGQPTRFSVICSGKDGVIAKRSYEFQGNRARLLGKQPWTPPVEAAMVPVVPAVEQPKEEGWFQRMKSRVTSLF